MIYEQNKQNIIKKDINVYFDNKCKVGVIKYDGFWEEWRIQIEPNVRLSYHWLKDIFKFMKTLK